MQGCLLSRNRGAQHAWLAPSLQVLYSFAEKEVRNGFQAKVGRCA